MADSPEPILVVRHCFQREARKGSLYLEALIVIGLAGMFLAILAPHFVRARMVARRTQCLNNLKNITLALQNYAELHETFPPGYVVRQVASDAPASEENGPGWGWATMILPALEQQSLYAAFDFRLDLQGSATLISTLLCPDDQSSPFSVTSLQFGLVMLGPSSYVGVAGRGSLTDEPGQPAGPGMFYRNSSVRLEEVRDGLSNTLLVGERRAFALNGEGKEVDTSATWVGAVSGAFRDPGYVGEKRLEGPGTLVLGIVGQSTPVPLKIPPNGQPPGLGFSSPHPGGVLFSRVDGSCSFISDSIDIDLFMRLGQRSDGEAASLP